MPQAEPRPRIVLADDHVRVLQSVSSLLETEFAVVASTSSGQQALDASERLDPDVVLLDITMPGLSGFQVARELKRRGSRAKIVFLTMHPADDFIEAAVKAGGQGYVLKTRIQPNLMKAVKQVLSGRMFMPSLAALSVASGGGPGHAVYFHAGDSTFLDEASGLAGTSLRRGEPFVLFTDEAMTRAIEQRLKAQGLDLSEYVRHGRYQAVNSATFLSQGMRNGRPDADCVRVILEGLERFRLSAAEGSRSRVTILGDLTSIWRGGPPDGAMELECLWEGLAHAFPFFTICAYSADCFSTDGHPNPHSSVCDTHALVGYG